MELVLIVTFSYKHVVHTKQTGRRGIASDLHSGGPWLKSQLGPLTVVTEVIGCYAYSLLANARVRSLQEGGNHETSSYSKGGVKTEGIWKESVKKNAWM